MACLGNVGVWCLESGLATAVVAADEALSKLGTNGMPDASPASVTKPCRCLCLGLEEHTTNTRPRLLTTRHSSQSFFTDARTFMVKQSASQVVTRVMFVERMKTLARLLARVRELKPEYTSTTS